MSFIGEIFKQKTPSAFPLRSFQNILTHPRGPPAEPVVFGRRLLAVTPLAQGLPVFLVIKQFHVSFMRNDVVKLRGKRSAPGTPLVSSHE